MSRNYSESKPCGPLTLTAVQDHNFWRKIAIPNDSEECWTWVAGKNGRGYGIFGIGKTTLAHRIMWRVTYGGIGAGICVCHSCDNPACVNPDHLWLGTNLDNTVDKVSKGRAKAPSGRRHYTHRKPHLIRRGTQRRGAKLDDDKVRRIRGMMGPDENPRAAAELFGVSTTLIRHVFQRRIWTHVT
jgi:hypothetical protein